MAQCRAAVFPEPNQPIEIRDVTIPDVAPGAVLLRTLVSEVCGTDVYPIP